MALPRFWFNGQLLTKYYTFLYVDGSRLWRPLRWYSVVYTGFCVWGGVPGAWGGVLFSLEKSKISHFFKLENFQKNVKKSMKIL